MEFPDLLDLNRTRSPAEWNDMLKRLRVKMKEIAATLADDANRPAAPIAGTGPDDPAANSPDLVRAKEYLAKRSGWSASRIGAMPPAQVLMLYLDGVLHDFRDQRFTAIYLPPAQAREQLRRTMASASSAPDTEAVRIVRIWMPAIDKVITAQSRLERKIAALRVIEALRIHAVRQGQLPDSLSHIQEVPVPIDPGTGEAFEYRKTGATATLTSRVPGEPVEKSGLRYTILLRN
jgi:hypothetical protein